MEMAVREPDQRYQFAAYRSGHQEQVTEGYGGADAEGQPKNLTFDNQSIRRGFIRKVYLILMGQLVVTFGTVSFFVFSEDAKKFAATNPFIFWMALGLMLVTVVSMMCCEHVRRQTPTNFIFLGMFTVAESFLLAVAASCFAPKGVLMAIGITAAICLCLTLFALQTKYDFTMMCGILIACLIVLVMFGFVAIFIQSEVVTFIYSALGAMLFSVYLIYDTQLMMGGNHKYSINPEEYIFATLNIYLDVTNIFLDILNILGLIQD